ncbi:hypothetical protein BGX26_006894, partial [Mortierella sp. AD094]
FSLHQIGASSSANEARFASRIEHNIPHSMDERNESGNCSATSVPPKGKKRKQSQKDDNSKDNDLEDDKDAPSPKKKTSRETATARSTPSSQAKQPPKKKAATVRTSKRQPNKAPARSSESLPKDIGEASEAVCSTPKRGRRPSAAAAASKPKTPTGGKKITRTRVSLDSSHIHCSRIESLCRSEGSAEPIYEHASTNESTADSNEDERISVVGSSNGHVYYTATEAVVAQVIAELYRGCPNLEHSAQSSLERTGNSDSEYRMKSPLEDTRNRENAENSESRHQSLPIQIPQEVFDRFIAMQQPIYDWGFRDGMLQRLEREVDCNCEARQRFHPYYIHSASIPSDEPVPPRTPAPNSLSPK